VGYDKEMEVYRWNSELGRSIKPELRLYAFAETIEEIEKMIPAFKDVELDLKKHDMYDDTLGLDRIVKIVENHRNSIKILIFASGTIGLMNHQTIPEAADLVYFPRYDKVDHILYDSVYEGEYVIQKKDRNYPKWKLALLLDTKDSQDAIKWCKLYEEADKLHDDNRNYQEMNQLDHPRTVGIFTLKQVAEFHQKVVDKVAEIVQLEQQEATNKAQALMQITVSNTQSASKALISALDGHIYTLTINEPMGWSLGDFINFVYVHRYNSHWISGFKTETMWDKWWQFFVTNSEKEITFGVDQVVPVKVKFSQIKDKRGVITRRFYLNGKIEASEDLHKVLKEYFYLGKPLIINTPPTLAQQANTAQVRSVRDEELITEGIKGTIDDLEGECPVELAFEKEGSKWYLVIGQHKVWIQGGLGVIHSLKTVLAGTAGSYRCRHSTQEFYARLAKVLGEDKALEILATAKEMGKMLQALKPKEE
jgi:hypothetical protein